MDAIMREIDFEKGGGLVTAIAQDAATGEILMLAHMNELAVRKTLETGEVHYWSRSRAALWHKGEESGNVQKLEGFYIDCDGDAVLVKVNQVGDAACHTGRRSCFFRKAEGDGYADIGVMIFDPKEVYKK
jgi:phosphoribosyl-AMP cyclohydrolase